MVLIVYCPAPRSPAVQVAAEALQEKGPGGPFWLWLISKS